MNITEEQFNGSDRWSLRNHIENLDAENKKFLEEIREDLDEHADWGGGGNWLTAIIIKIEQKLIR